MTLFGQLKDLAFIFRDTFNQWLDREPFRSTAVIAFYTIFSLPGLLVIIINLAGYFYGEEAVTRRISSEIEGMIGGNTAKDIEAIIANASVHQDFTFASIVGLATLIFGATGVFYQLQQTLNQIWEVKPEPKRVIVKMILDRLFSFGLILAVGFLLLVSLILSAVLTVLSDWVAFYFSETFNVLFRLLDISLSLAVVTFLFAAIFKFLPDAEVPWRDVWIGALVTALLFVLAKFGLGFYFGHSNPASAYGAAGTIILIMLWVSYAGLIVLFGAEFTRIYADRRGERIKPLEFAVSTCDADATEDSTVNPNRNTEAALSAHEGTNSRAASANHDAPATDLIYPVNKDLVLGHKASAAASPESMSISGEEDPGVGLEFLVTSNKQEK
ncbi:MAG: YihY/virulence factor BrkB family protein [Cellvibrio sp.]|uniref:YihY/virulence factor BrkB family protein n=1 Tax=Cellvibrio sp. TaxID=1965322 RepID=UPI0031AED57F